MKDNSDNNTIAKDIEVVLIVPFGVEDNIFPWGAYSVKEYLGTTFNSIPMSFIDFRNDEYFPELLTRYKDLLSQIFFTLSIHQINTFFGQINNPYIFLGFVACVGEDFFPLTGQKVNPSHVSDLQALQKDFNNHLSQKINSLKTRADNVQRIWGLSVFDRTLFNCLYIARLIKENDPVSSIILGGDYFNFEAATVTIKGTPLVDGIVVGYGEEVMKKIILEIQQGHSISDLQIPGLINRSYLQNQDKPDLFTQICVPPSYKELATKPAISYVNQNKAGVIRVLSQRGCSWGKCSFCTQIDKEMFYPVSVDHIIQEVQKILESQNTGTESRTIKISFDSDENSIGMLIQFIKYLDSLESGNTTFDLVLWLQVKMFRKELAEALAAINSQKVRILFKLNFESLNIDTLKNMRKGHSPLQAIEAAKAVQDCGHSFISNYFIHFPLENSANILQEVEILQRAVHLLMPPKGKIVLFPYESNNRDSIYQNQEKYKIKINRLRGDIFLKTIFGIDLPFSQWVYYYDEKPSFNLERLLAHTYYKALMLQQEINLPGQIASANWGETKMLGFARIARFFRLLKSSAWSLLYRSLLLTGKGRALRKRAQLTDHFLKIQEISAPVGASQNAKEASILQSRFYLKDNYLIKEYHIPGATEKWQLEIDPNELKILRHLYWTKKYDDVVKVFKDEIPKAEITRVINRHLERGSLIRFKGLLLSVFNDPDYCKSFTASD